MGHKRINIDEGDDGPATIVYGYNDLSGAPALGNPSSALDCDTRNWSISQIILPFIVESLQPTGFRKDVIDRAIEYLSSAFPHPPSSDTRICSAALNILISADFPTIERDFLTRCLSLILGSAGLSSDRARYIFGEDEYLRLVSDWSSRVNDVLAARSSMIQQVVEAAKADQKAAHNYKSDGTVVVSNIGTPGHDHAARVDPSIKAIVGIKIPKAKPAISASEFADRMGRYYPHMTDLVKILAGEVSDVVKIRPRILVGPPGCGKTSFWTKTFDALAVPYVIYGCGGDADSTTFRGASRKWSTTGPSFPISTITNLNVANPVIILDEIEKVAQSRYNGNLTDVLLGMLEPSTSSRWFDPHIEAPIDLSHIIWVATANQLDGLSPAFLDRWAISKIEAPDEKLGATIAKNIAADLGCIDLAPDEITGIIAAWGAGSIRKLKKIVTHYVEKRDMYESRH